MPYRDRTSRPLNYRRGVTARRRTQRRCSRCRGPGGRNLGLSDGVKNLRLIPRNLIDNVPRDTYTETKREPLKQFVKGGNIVKDRVHPELRCAFAGFLQSEFSDDVTKLRATWVIPETERSPSVDIHSTWVKGLNGEPDVRVKVYKPVTTTPMAPLPVVIWIHGGGYILGHPDQDDGLCQRFVNDVHCVVVSVDYRLAPENPFPAGLYDCYTVLEWIVSSSAELCVDANRIAVAGNSAGGGLTAGLTLLARDRGGPRICFQMPLYPMIDDRNVTPSSFEIDDGRLWNRKNNIAAWQMYLGKSSAEDDISPYAAPSRATDLSGLPPTYTCIGELDLFRDETTEYVSRLIHSGVPVEYHIYPGCFHGFELDVPEADISRSAMNEYVGALARALHA